MHAASDQHHAPRRSRFTPEPAGDLPDGLVLFDGVCVLCSGWVKFILARDCAQRFRFASIQGDYGRRLALRLGLDPADPQTNAVVLGGRVLFKSDSALGVLGELPGWRWTRPLRALPRGLRDWVYDRIARNRYGLFGRYDSCVRLSAGDSGRFID